MSDNQGSKANRTGNLFVSTIEQGLQSVGYSFINKSLFSNESLSAIYTKELYICDSIYNTKLNCDFILYHPTKHKDCLVIEAKWQQAGGTVDEKYPFLVLNIKEKSPYKTIIVLDGGGYKRGAEAWLKAQVDNKLIYVINTVEFLTLINDNYF